MNISRFLDILNILHFNLFCHSWAFLKILFRFYPLCNGRFSVALFVVWSCVAFFVDLPDADWNSVNQLQRLRHLICCLKLPEFSRSDEELGDWSVVCADVWNYVDAIIDIDRSCSRYLSRYWSRCWIDFPLSDLFCIFCLNLKSFFMMFWFLMIGICK